jgi:mannosyltransferase
VPGSGETQISTSPAGESTASTRRPVATAATIAVAVAVLGVAIRALGMDASLWLDEFGTLWTVEGSLRQTWERALAFQGQSPLYYTLAWFSLQGFGESAIALRLPSLLFGCAATAAVWAAGRQVAGPRAGQLGAVLFWFSGPVVAASANARPYSLAILATAVAMLGFARVTARGDVVGRVLWVCGATVLVWAHFLQAFVLVGLAVGYIVLPPLRRQYPTRAFVLDAAIIGLLSSFNVLQIMTLFGRRDALAWVPEANHLAVAGMIAPFLLAAVADLGSRRVAQDPNHGRECRQAIALAVIGHLMLLEALWLMDINLLVPRYAVVIVVPAALLAGVGLAGVRYREAVPAMAVFALFTLIGFLGSWRTAGTLTGLGVEDWQSAVELLDRRLGPTSATPVLFRSGFVEQDATATGGRLLRVTTAPLRQPGQPAPRWRVVELSYRWHLPGREHYFAKSVSPAIDSVSEFYLLSSNVVADAPYAEAIETWVESRWPDTFTATPLNAARGITLVHFQRRD